MVFQEISINPFKMHLNDAILAAHLAKNTAFGTPAEARAARVMLCRTAVAHAVFAFESAANCFLDRIPRGRAFRDKAEKWSALDKLDLYLLSVPAAPRLRRDDLRVKAMIDLIKIRDKHVHPRVVTHPVTATETADIKISIKLPPDPALNMVSLGMAWSVKDAILAINTVLEFLRMFIQLTRMSAAGVQAILSDVVKCDDGSRIADTGGYDPILVLGLGLEIDVGFLFPRAESARP
ncbi:MAG: hypothetical protein M3119_00240 [Verrucomicrobiota bacterium]|nr:hypothetical protein [Verrucomicrobiota bacterium]MDQ6938566.1 hypothetical protein [Verrucomicrobiota bacterium]